MRGRAALSRAERAAKEDGFIASYIDPNATSGRHMRMPKAWDSRSLSRQNHNRLCHRITQCSRQTMPLTRSHRCIMLAQRTTPRHIYRVFSFCLSLLSPPDTP